jgi:sugar lactone lactonase YvrE
MAARSLGSVEVAIPAQAVLGECPRWDAAASRLSWVDVKAGALHLFDPATRQDRRYELGAMAGAAAPTEGGELLVALADRVVLVDPGDGSTRALVRFPHPRPDMRTNDGACDPAGRFWVGSTQLEFSHAAGALYRLARGVLERVLDDVTLSNGIGWSPDGRLMYYVDSLTYRVDVLDFDVESGTVAGRRELIGLSREDGVPDGLAVDDNGCIWLALYGGACVRRYGPDGSLDGVLSLPVNKVTACCFGGDDGHSLYVTTAAGRQPLSGSVFVADVGVGGPPAHAYRG